MSVCVLAYVLGYWHASTSEHHDFTLNKVTIESEVLEKQALVGNNNFPTRNKEKTNKTRHVFSSDDNNGNQQQSIDNSNELLLHNNANNIHTLEKYLLTTAPEDYQQELLIALITGSADALAYLNNFYLDTNDGLIISMLASVIKATPYSNKISLAEKLLYDLNIEKRQLAYTIYTNAVQFDPAAILYLIDATYSESNIPTLIELLDAISDACSAHDGINLYHCESRLGELTFNHNEDISISAIYSLSKLSQNQVMVDILKTHLSTSSNKLKLAALNAANAISPPDSELVERIVELSKDANSSPEITLAAKMFLNSIQIAVAVAVAE